MPMSLYFLSSESRPQLCHPTRPFLPHGSQGSARVADSEAAMDPSTFFLFGVGIAMSRAPKHPSSRARVGAGVGGVPFSVVPEGLGQLWGPAIVTLKYRV